jgi:hypothetical protein
VHHDTIHFGALSDGRLFASDKLPSKSALNYHQTMLPTDVKNDFFSFFSQMPCVLSQRYFKKNKTEMTYQS